MDTPEGSPTPEVKGQDVVQPGEGGDGEVVELSSAQQRTGASASLMAVYSLMARVPIRGAVLLLAFVVVSTWVIFVAFTERPEALPAWVTAGEAYRLVPESISQSAYLPIRIPEEAGAVTEEQVTIVPELLGSFVSSDQSDLLLFKPQNKPEPGSYYRVELAYAHTVVAADVLVAEDPAILSILPSAEFEVHEETDISIIFNRPMVPLSTRTEMDQYAVPVRLEPSVAGIWKWKSTRLLQFIPESGLRPATRYRVSVDEGFRSIDGVAVPNVTHEFTTRTVKHHPLPRTVRFDAPLEVVFNQPIDLERTAAEITLSKDGKPIEFLVQYAKKEPERPGLFGLTLFGKKEDVNQSRLWIQPRADVHGRAGFWDFEADYRLTINKQYPLNGQIVREQGIFWSYAFPPILKNLDAYSERSDHVDANFFDPEGELVATFFEPVDLERTVIVLQGLRDVRYGTTCREDEDGRIVRDPQTKKCVEEDDPTVLRIRVQPGQYERGFATPLTFSGIVSKSGLVLAEKPITKTITTVPPFAITKTFPANGETGASVTSLVVCSNTPLARPESVRDVLSVDGYVVYPDSAWSNSYRQMKPRGSRAYCDLGEFETRIRYGLHPERRYALSLDLADQFGERRTESAVVTTQQAPSMYTRFHNLQKYYNTTVPGKTRLTYAVENLPSVVMHACKVSPETLLRVIETDALGESLPPASWCTAVRTVPLTLPETYWVNNYFHLDIAEYFEDVRGHYIITFTSPAYRDQDNRQRYDHTLVSVSNLTVGEKRINYSTYALQDGRIPTPAPEGLYWVLSAGTLEPIEGAKVTSYKGSDYSGKDKSISIAGTGVTNAEGVARILSTPHTTGAVVERGGDTAVVSEGVDTLQSVWASGGESRTYLYTDRPIYRPGDTVEVRGIDRVGYDQAWSITEGVETAARVYTSRNDILAERTVRVSSYGTFNFSVALPPDTPLGTYRIEVFGNSGWFEVEEYRGAPFKVAVEADENEYVAGDTANLRIRAEYYFGMPVADAEVAYTILAQDYHFDRYRDEYFNFGRGWYTCVSCGYGDQFIARGNAVLDERGGMDLEVPLDFGKHFVDPEKEGSKIYTILARTTDTSGNQVTGQQSIIVHRGAHYLGVNTDPYYAAVNEEVALRVKSVDTQGAGKSLTDVAVVVSKIEWETYKRREVDGGYYWHSEEKRTTVHTAKLATDKQGDGLVSFTPKEPGSYSVVVSRSDAAGNPVFGETHLYVWGSGQVAVRETNNATLALSTDKPSYAVGEEATVLVESPFTTARALFTVERGDILTYWTKPVASSLTIQKVPVLSSYEPNVYVSALLVGPGPDVKYGTVELKTGTEHRELVIETTPTKARYLPGEDIELRVRARTAAGAPVRAEVSIAVVDLSVLALVGNPKKDPVSFFYGDTMLGVSTAHSAKNMLVEKDIPLGTKGGGGGEPERRKRGIFKDTAYFVAGVETNDAGEATVRFTMPDNLTTWQIESLGVTRDTKLGVGYAEFLSTKQLMAIPLRPRFVVPGDTVFLGMQVANNTDTDLTVRTRIESPTLTIVDTEERTVRVPAGKTEVVYFKTTAPRERTEGTHVVTFYALHEGYEDVVEQAIPILQDRTMEVTATAGMMTGALIRESIMLPSSALLEGGTLSVRARPTLIASMLGAVGEMYGYPYGCTEQVASRLASLSTITRAEKLYGSAAIAPITASRVGVDAGSIAQTVRTTLPTLLARQHYSGGFSFYENSQPSMYLTVEVLQALTVLRDAGYEVPDSVFERAAKYILEELAGSIHYERDDDMLARVTFAFASPYVPTSSREALMPRVAQLTGNTLRMERLSSLALAHLAIGVHMAPYNRETSERMFAALVNRTRVDARGAYVAPVRGGGYGWFESAEKNTALLVYAIALRGGSHPLADNLMRWLATSKRANGGWGSTNATFTVLDAMLRISATRKEQDASYVLALLHGDEQVATHAVHEDNLLDEFAYVFPLERFTRERLEQVALRKEGEGTAYYDLELRYALPADLVPPRDEGVTVLRTLTIVGDEAPTQTATVGDLVLGVLEITVPKDYRAVSIESFVPAGFEIVNLSFATEDSRDLEEYDALAARVAKNPLSEPRKGPREFPVTYRELHDDRVFAFAERVSPGTYRFSYLLRALVPGTYRHMPAVVKEMYRPEVFGRTEGGTFTIRER